MTVPEVSAPPQTPARSEVKPLREGSAAKRAAILSAARELFVSEGFDRVSVDAISARAGVSKRTVYDYFGDKRALLVAVIEEMVTALYVAVEQAVDENLADVTAENLEQSLVGFSVELGVSAIGTVAYSELLRLVSSSRLALPDLRLAIPLTEPEDILAEHFERYGRAGLLEVPDPRLAVDHFTALTMLPAISRLNALGTQSPEDARLSIVEGVRVFLRAYGAGAGGVGTG